MEEQTYIDQGSRGKDRGASTHSLPEAKVDELQQELEEAKGIAEKLRDQLLRKSAEFENYKRRVSQEGPNAVKNADEALITSLLPVLDDFDRALELEKKRKNALKSYDGMELIHRKLIRALEQRGLVAFESLGKPFDVGQHHAILEVPSPDVPPQTVVRELERGYKLNDKVLRYAKVIVSCEPHPSRGHSETRNEEWD